MNWYDLFARFYDPAIERIYRRPRRLAFAHLQTDLGPSGLDLACGTGQNLPLLIERLGADVRWLGVDSSPGMLQRAQRRATRAGWSNVALLEADARSLSAEQLKVHRDGNPAVDYVVCTLGLSAVPEWESVFESCFRLLRPGGQFLELPR